VRVARQFLVFAAVGLIGTTAHYATLIIAVALGLEPVAASALGATIGAAVNYVLNYHVTFRSGAAHWHSVPRYAVVTVSSIALNTLFMAIAVRLLHLHYLLAQILATGCVLFANFALSRAWAFSLEKSPAAIFRTSAALPAAKGVGFAAFAGMKKHWRQLLQRCLNSSGVS
jgi:putative flippase GtrA